MIYRKPLNLLALIFSFASLSQAQAQAPTPTPPNYCLAIRGNGEVAVAHWGGMATIVEKLGIPKGQAGGSSATISMFLLDSVASNPHIKSDVPLRASLLIKSFSGFLTSVRNRPEFQDLLALASYASNMQTTDWITNLQGVVGKAKNAGSADQAQMTLVKSAGVLKKSLTLGNDLGVLEKRNHARLLKALQVLISPAGSVPPDELHKALRQADFYLNELKRTISVFGKFDARDVNMFFRAGIVSFEGVARQFGRVGDFYSSHLSEPVIEKQWTDFFDSCAEASRGKTWDELIQSMPACQDKLGALITTHFAQQNGIQDYSRRMIGQSIASYPTTSVLVNRSDMPNPEKNKNLPSAFEQAVAKMREYHEALDLNFGNTFVIADPETIRFGYWGRSDVLETIKKNLPQDDEKSSRFLALGNASWGQVIRLSAREPGLGSMAMFKANGRPYISAGGWSDLHPVLVLKASDCKNVVYLSRRGGESLFGQGIAKRLLNFQRPWEYLVSDIEADAKKNNLVNNSGDTSPEAAQDVVWNNLYNLANPKSSYQRSLKAADAVLCTDWNQFNIKTPPSRLVEEAYHSPFYVAPQGGLSQQANLTPLIDPALKNPAGYLEYAGCFPQ